MKNINIKSKLTSAVIGFFLINYLCIECAATEIPAATAASAAYVTAVDNQKKEDIKALEELIKDMIPMICIMQSRGNDSQKKGFEYDSTLLSLARLPKQIRLEILKTASLEKTSEEEDDDKEYDLVGKNLFPLIPQAYAEMVKIDPQMAKEAIKSLLRKIGFKENILHSFLYFNIKIRRIIFTKIFEGKDDSYLEAKKQEWNEFYKILKEIATELAHDPTADARFSLLFSGDVGCLKEIGDFYEPMPFGNILNQKMELSDLNLLLAKNKITTLTSKEADLIEYVLIIFLEIPIIISKLIEREDIPKRNPEEIALAVQNALQEPGFAEITLKLAGFLRKNIEKITIDKQKTELLEKVMLPCLEQKEVDFSNLEFHLKVDSQKIQEYMGLKYIPLNDECKVIFSLGTSNGILENNNFKDNILNIIFPEDNYLRLRTKDNENLRSDENILNTIQSLKFNKDDLNCLAQIFEKIDFKKLDSTSYVVDGVALGQKVANLIRTNIESLIEK